VQRYVVYAMAVRRPSVLPSRCQKFSFKPVKRVITQTTAGTG